jgi:pimeloyl-ACP methyl ester carboxylesterase
MMSGMGEYIETGGVRTYYEAVGEGDPVVLIHGGATTGESWAAQIPALAERYQVFVPDRRGHGRSPDVEGPATMDGFAADRTPSWPSYRGRRMHCRWRSLTW